MSTVKILEINSTSSEDTEAFGALLGFRLKGGEIIELISDLGGGKTTLVRGLGRGAGSHDVVSSPTFMIQKQYRCANFTLHHFDFYRLGNDKAVIEQTLAEEVSSGDVVIMEWAERIDSVPSERVRIELKRTVDGEDYREITCHYPDTYDYLFETGEQA